MDYNLALLLGAVLSLLAAVMHLWCIAVGPAGYRWMGAGERMVRAAEKGKRFPTLITLAIALVLVIWAAYALSGAGVIGPLPLLRPALCVITLVYLLRGFAGPLMLRNTGRSTGFIVVSSVICAGYGLVHLAGLIQVWDRLG
ncbi:hypothetical protein V0R50_24405 [Pseudomonas sp. 148P]|uniref:Uncharacterized protein n=1 Tax=Pseudomonas ulcerans TaxID=3115852 RepID=A0ABU7HXS7_9PSED|nr:MULTISPECIES: hypothetical protein [unclassified Pseudomonas]MEE1924766.1 hypothetical protein [Pseudomonas sp. 147P]MEE1936382.1 hypothetical protein [Pseudomonas sp. 148P]